MLQIITFLICLRCCHSNLLLCMCRGIKKGRKLHICQDIGLILLKFGAGGYFWILSPKSTIKFLCDVIFTSKWREGKIPIYRLQKVHITPLWRHPYSDFFENVNLFSSYDGLSAHQIFLIWMKGSKVTEGGRNPPPPPGRQCIKTPRWDRVNICFSCSFLIELSSCRATYEKCYKSSIFLSSVRWVDRFKKFQWHWVKQVSLYKRMEVFFENFHQKWKNASCGAQFRYFQIK